MLDVGGWQLCSSAARLSGRRRQGWVGTAARVWCDEQMTNPMETAAHAEGAEGRLPYLTLPDLTIPDLTIPDLTSPYLTSPFPHLSPYRHSLASVSAL